MDFIKIVSVPSLKGASGDDGVIIITSSLSSLASQFSDVHTAVQRQAAIDASVPKSGCLVPLEGVAGGRVIFSPTGPLNRDYDDGRRWCEAAATGIKRAIESGCKSPVLVFVADAAWPRAALLTMLGALDALYVPLEIREDVPERRQKMASLSVLGISTDVIKTAYIMDQAKSTAKDIGGSDPERMAPPRVEEYVTKMFGGSNCIKMEVVKDDNQLVKEFPLFSAVNRCAKGVERHRGCIIFLTYTPPEGSYSKTLFLVGKGVTYDTGGADIKAGGVMAGMHRDKCGAAAVGGYFKYLQEMKPKGVKVVGAMCMVRNSVGSECYVADEIITSRAGVRVRIGNTDAEGRMAMADSLFKFKEMARKEKDAQIFTIATLTGHCVLAFGEGYTAIMDNGPSREEEIARKFQKAGEKMAEPVEISTIRREDYAFHAGKSEYEDVLQSNNAPSSRTARGHQAPAAFLILASGLDKHGIDSDCPLKYSHIDIAGAAGPFPGLPTGAPILALADMFAPPKDI